MSEIETEIHRKGGLRTIEVPDSIGTVRAQDYGEPRK